MKAHFLDEFYTIDSDTGDYMINITLENYDDIFNRWDSSVYNVRDLDSSLKSFLQECSEDIDLRHRIKLRFHIHSDYKDEAQENNIIEGFRNHYNYRLHFTRKKLNTQWKRIVLYTGSSVVFTALSLYLQGSFGTNIFQQVLLQALLLGGWVFLWEAFSLLFFQRTELLRKKRGYKRMIRAPLSFRYWTTTSKD